jgi:hypothetical protein
MKKVLALLNSGSLFLYTATSVYAQAGEGLSNPGIDAELDFKKIPQLIVNLLFMVAAFLAVAYLMYGGIKWITSRGDKVAVESARKHIMAAVIGLVVVAGAFFILQVVFTVLGVSCNPLKDGFVLPTLNNLSTDCS